MTIAPEKTQTQVQLRVGQEWFALCALSLLTPGRGVAALLPDGSQAAVFVDREGAVHAIDNRDPFTGAQVLSRGLLGSAAAGLRRVAAAQAALRPAHGPLSGRRCGVGDGIRSARGVSRPRRPA